MNPIALILAAILWFAASASAQTPAQDTNFNPVGMSGMAFQSRACTGFYNTPTWQCTPVTLPAYLLKASDRRAVVVISHGSQGLDKRHSDYAKHLVDNGINAVVLGHWEARGLGQIHFDFDRARRQGGDSPNQVLDVLAAGSQMKAMSEWRDATFGHLGESMGGTTALNLTRPYLRRAFNDIYGEPPIQLSAIVSLYAGCTERNTAEAFLPTPLLFVSGERDDNTLASDCEKQVQWMNGRGGLATIVVLSGEAHDFDAPYFLHRASRAQNPSKCANLRDGNKFTLEVNGKDYPGTPEGYAQMRRDCISMTRGGVLTGHRGNPKTGYPEWITFFLRHLTAIR